ncbi:hypothetical protein CC78DRAFT_574499 [Lojkania enalia]|uniref:Uncharacterized protein n=1 Tax=Lojkania enalia TaxID=147567 RepID=A0A9P4NAG4_9PLEO|nr:hypothetical protein CC78DRAFT_574499 [Didymosphaeria enalia]
MCYIIQKFWRDCGDPKGSHVHSETTEHCKIHLTQGKCSRPQHENPIHKRDETEQEGMCEFCRRDKGGKTKKKWRDKKIRESGLRDGEMRPAAKETYSDVLSRLLGPIISSVNDDFLIYRCRLPTIIEFTRLAHRGIRWFIARLRLGIYLGFSSIDIDNLKPCQFLCCRYDSAVCLRFAILLFDYGHSSFTSGCQSR